eukprot:1114641-Rhodomonas_salina.1
MPSTHGSWRDHTVEILHGDSPPLLASIHSPQGQRTSNGLTPLGKLLELYSTPGSSPWLLIL